DGGTAAGDGCSPTCTFEVSCPAGSTLFQVRATDVPIVIPDSNPTGANSMVVVPAADQGAIRKVVVGIGRLDHTYDGDMTLSLVPPPTRTRNLIVRRGSGGDNFIMPRLDDAAATAVSAASPPFTGAFRPEETLSDASGYFGQNALARHPAGPDGTWKLHMVD